MKVSKDLDGNGVADITADVGLNGDGVPTLIVKLPGLKKYVKMIGKYGAWFPGTVALLHSYGIV